MAFDAISATREHLLTGNALMMAVALDQSLSQEARDFSDTCDRLELLRAKYHCVDLAVYFCSVKRKTGLTVDLYEDVPGHKLTAHRENFAAALAALADRAA